jgi:hypothetical protein
VLLFLEIDVNLVIMCCESCRCESCEFLACKSCVVQSSEYCVVTMNEMRWIL